MRFIFFLDALDYQDLGDGWLKKNAVQYTPNVPRVTPNVVSQIMTGRRDPEFIRPTPYRKPRATDLKGETILHYATGKGFKVLQYGIPLCSKIELPKESLTTYDHFLRAQPVPPVLRFAQTRKNFRKGDLNDIFNAYVDDTVLQFASLRNIARNGQFDIFFWGYQPLDAYTHWYDEKRRKDLIKVLEAELQQTQKDLGADIFFFSDHGSTRKKKMFRINIWLKEKGWLDYHVNYKLFNYNVSYAKRERPFKDQISLDSPFVFIDWEKTRFYCTDAFDSMIDFTENATAFDKTTLAEQLMETGYFDDVVVPGEIDGLDLIMPETKEGICCSCNVHKNAEEGDNIGNIRTGWHSKRAVVGSSTRIPLIVKKPTDIYGLMKEFIDLEKPPETKPKEGDVALEPDIKALGYI